MQPLPTHLHSRDGLSENFGESWVDPKGLSKPLGITELDVCAWPTMFILACAQHRGH